MKRVEIILLKYKHLHCSGR